MGLFSFVQSAGRKVGMFGGREAAEADQAADAAKAAKEAARSAAQGAQQETLARAAVAADIKAAILSYVEIDALQVRFDGETASLSGTVNAQADQEKALLVAGNTVGVASVDNQIEVLVPEPPAVYHQVVRGDTLSKIAGEYYGVMRAYDVIFDANRPMLNHPDEIYPGQTLRIPPIAAPIHTVVRGDTLFKISKHWYGDGKRYPDVFAANTDVLSSPEALEVGQQIRIPLVNPKASQLNG